MQLGIYLCVERQWKWGKGNQKSWQGNSFSKVSHLTVAASETYRNSQLSAKTCSLLNAIEAESDITAHSDEHTSDALVGKLQDLKNGKGKKCVTNKMKT